MLTSYRPDNRQISFIIQQPDLFPALKAPAPILITVNQPPPAKPKNLQQKGGWAITSYISREDYAFAKHAKIELERQGYKPTILATVRPDTPDLSDSEAKKEIGLKFARLGQALERKGHSYIGIICYEKSPDGLMHGHALLHVRRGQRKVVARWADIFGDKGREGPDVPIHARPAVASDIDYILKQHRWSGPHEKRKRFYEKGQPFRGQRISYTAATKNILGIEKPAKATKKQQQPTAIPLPMMTQPIPVFELVEAKRKKLCLPQHALAILLGIKQAAYANIIRGHDKPGARVIQRAQEFLAGKLSPWVINHAPALVAERLAA